MKIERKKENKILFSKRCSQSLYLHFRYDLKKKVSLYPHIQSTEILSIAISFHFIFSQTQQNIANYVHIHIIIIIFCFLSLIQIRIQIELNAKTFSLVVNF